MRTLHSAADNNVVQYGRQKRRLGRRFLSLLLCISMLIPMLSNFGGVLPMSALTGDSSGPTAGVNREADPSTMDTYVKMLNFDENTRWAGRLWSDKSVFAYGAGDIGDRSGLWLNNILTLSEALDGTNGSITLNNDFLHVYSALGSSLQITGVPPVRTVIVFDNSASMYNSNSNGKTTGADGTSVEYAENDDLWNLQRIGITIEAINRAIDILMEASVYNEVAVVLFGDGANKVTPSDNTFAYSGNSTAVTILPMKHYTPQKTEGEGEDKYTPYLTGGWNSGSTCDGSSPLHTGSTPTDDEKKNGVLQKAYTSGWVFVDNEICGLTQSTTGEEWSGKGFNGCGDNKYTAYINGTTNIQAGYYVGMQELLKADKTVKVGSETYKCVPSLVMLTDGAATDKLSGTFITPDIAEGSEYPTHISFVNDTGNKLRSFTGYDYNNNDKEIRNFWDMFVEKNASGKYESVVKPGQTGKSPTHEATVPAGEGLEAMQHVADTYSDSVASMLLGTLMTTSYYKAAVKYAYGMKKDDNWDIYSLTVDMLDVSEVPEGAADAAKKDDSNKDPKDELPQNWEYGITSNAPTMNPSKFFYNEEGKIDLSWLQEKGYIDSGVDLTEALKEPEKIIGHTAYPTYSVGEMVIQGIVKAACYLTKWIDNTEFTTNYQGWDEVKGILAHDKDNTKPTGENWETSKYTNPYTHSNGYLLEEEVTISWPQIDSNNAYKVTKQDVIENIAYNSEAYYAQTTATAAKNIADTFNEIVQAITEPLFTPVGGMNDLGVGDAVTYMDPLGKYMDIKDVKNLLLFGQLYEITEAAVYDYRWNHQYMTNKKESDKPLTEGWYRGTPTVGSNVGVEYKNKGELDPEKAWADGWVYRISYSDASKFVPTLNNINSNESPDKTVAKMRNTEYTFYRIALDEKARQTLHMNPAYLTPGQTEEEALEGKTYSENGDHLDDAGVYALDDLRIWVENSGDFSDNTVEGTLTDTNFDEALWINIPVNMLPLRTVSINLGKTGESFSWDYTTNLDKDDRAYVSSFPLRVFYSVGMSSDVLENSNRINVAGAIGAEYIQQNKITNATAATVRGIAQGNIEFFSNWYNPLNRYSDYATTKTDYTFGDPVTSFSPSTNNRYYAFEKALPLYSTAYVWVPNPEAKAAPEGSEDVTYTKDQGRWRRVVIDEDAAEGEDVRTFAPSDFGGHLIALDLTPDDIQHEDDARQKSIWEALTSERRIEKVHDGDIILLKNHRLTDVTKPEDESEDDPFDPEGYYFFPIDYYDLDPENHKATWTQYVITRKGSEFGSAYQAAGITNGDMLCWHDVSNTNFTDYPYLSYTETSTSEKNELTGDRSRGRDYIGYELDPATGYYKDCDRSKHEYPDVKTNEGGNKVSGEWVVCAKPGGLRVGDLAQNVQGKGGDYITPEGMDDYLAERFVGFDSARDLNWGYYADNVTRTANNYYVPTISTTSNIESDDIIVNVYLGNNGRLTVEDTTLLITKLVELPEGMTVDTNEEFNFQLYISGMTGTQYAVVIEWNEATNSWQRQFHYIDLELDAQLFLQTSDGAKAIVEKEGCRLVPDGEGTYTYAENCINSSGTHSEGDPYTGDAYYVYIGTNRGTTETGAANTAFRVYHNESVDNERVSEEDVTVVGDSGEEGTFYAAKVWLVNVSTFDTAWQGKDPVSDADFELDDSLYEIELTDKIKLLTINPNVSETTEITFTTPYRTSCSYWTKMIEFGVNANPNDGSGTVGDELTSADLYDQIIPKYDRPDYFGTVTNAQIAKNTAEFTLKHGQALLFSGIPSASVYRVTEKLTKAQRDAGYALKEVSHNQQVGSVCVYRPGEQSIPVYINEGTTYGDYGGKDAEGKYVYPEMYSGYTTEKGLTWSLSQDGTKNDENYIRHEPFHHTNAVMWEYYATMSATAKGDNHHQPDSVEDGTSIFWLWEEDKNASSNTGHTHTILDNPSCKSIEDGGCDEILDDGNVRHYMFRNGELVDQHYQGEGSGYLRNIARYLVSPTAHFGVFGETQEDAEKVQTAVTSNTDYNGVYSVFGNTGTYEESANFVNTKSDEKTETEINGEEVTSPDGQNFPGVTLGDEITYEIEWTNDAVNDNGAGIPAHVIITDPLDDGVDYSTASFDENVGSGAKVAYYDTVEAAVADGYGKYVTQKRTVVWDLGETDAGAHGVVTLKVKVNKNAAKYWDYDMDGTPDAPVTPDEDHLVRNRATIYVADNGHDTNKVVNPVGEPDKNEVEIDHTGSGGTVDSAPEVMPPEDEDSRIWEGPLVYVGDKITYEISWRNYKNLPADIFIRDPLDPNVKFISAEFTAADGSEGAPSATLSESDLENGVGKTTQTVNVVTSYKEDGTPEVDAEGNLITEERPVIELRKSESGLEVVWNLGSQPKETEGKVRLTVEVLSTATPVGYVDNNAYVKVGNDNEQETKTIRNPTPQVNKDETTINGNDIPDTDDPMKPQVNVGDLIGYTISWDRKDPPTAPETVTVLDPLDPGVDFHSASYEGVTLNAGTEGNKVTVGDVTIEYIPDSHTVKWTISNFTGTSGEVALTVKVNSKAVENSSTDWNKGDEDGIDPNDPKWDYRDGDGIEKGEEKQLVQNRGAVKFGNDSLIFTELVQNPLGDTGNLRIEKQVAPYDHDPGETEFTFTVEFTPADGVVLHSEAINVIKNGELIEFTDWIEKDGKLIATSKLKKDESIVFGKIPLGTTYLVYETWTEGYNLQRVEKKGVDGEFEILTTEITASGTISEKGVTYEYRFVNMPVSELPFTGGAGTAMIYCAAVILLALPIILYIGFRRRRRLS